MIVDPLAMMSEGRASDAAFLAAADLAAISAELDVAYRLVGGNAVTLLVAIHGVGHLVPARETADADFGADFPVVADPRLLDALIDHGYRQTAGNRFTREHGLPALGAGPDPTWNLAVDVLAPSYEGRLVTGQAHGKLVVDEIPGLALALARAGHAVTVDVGLTSGHRLTTDLLLPDVVSAMCLKAHAYAGRFTDRDAVDMWRLLEAAFAAGVTPDAWPGGPTATGAAEVLRQHFGRPGSAGPRRATSAAAQQTRIRALVGQVVGPG